MDFQAEGLVACTAMAVRRGGNRHFPTPGNWD